MITSALVGANLGGVELGWPMFALRCRVAIDKDKSMIDVALLLRGCELKATYLQYPRQYVGSRFSLFLETKTQAISRSQL